MTRQTLTDEQRRTVCREMCDGVPRAKPTHPRLQQDIDNAYFTALKSPTFRSIVAGLEQTPTVCRDAEILNALDTLVLDDNELGEVILSSGKTAGARVVMLHLGHNPLPCGIGDDVRGAIQHGVFEVDRR